MAGLPRDHVLERITSALDDPGPPQAGRPAGAIARRAISDREKISVTVSRPAEGRSLRLLRQLDPQASTGGSRSMRTTLPAGKAKRFTRSSRSGSCNDNCNPERLRARAEALLGGGGDPSDASGAVGAPAAGGDRLDRADGARRTRPRGGGREAEIQWRSVALRNCSSMVASIGSISCPTAALAPSITRRGSRRPRKPSTKASRSSSGLLGLIGRAGGFEGVTGDPKAFEYWSLTAVPRAISAG